MIIFSPTFSSFNGNVYEFVIQVYQLSINNFGANQLFQRHAIYALSRLLGMNIYCLKLTGQWRYAENKTIEQTDHAKLLNSLTIYLRELQFENQIGKNYRMLLPKKLWLSNRFDNMNISLRFSQFSDPDIFQHYQQKFFNISVNEMLRNIFGNRTDLLSPAQRAFCVLIYKISLEQLIKTEMSGDHNRSFSSELTSTLAKRFEMFENSANLDQLYSLLDSLVEIPKFFTNSNVERTFLKIIS